MVQLSANANFWQAALRRASPATTGRTKIIHAATLEMAQVGADHRVVDEAVRAQLNAADGFEKFSDGHTASVSIT